MDDTQTQAELQKKMYDRFIQSLKEYDNLSDETKEQMIDDEENQLLDLEIFDQRHWNLYKVKAVLCFWWPNEWVTCDDRYNGAT